MHLYMHKYLVTPNNAHNPLSGLTSAYIFSKNVNVSKLLVIIVLTISTFKQIMKRYKLNAAIHES